MTVTSDQLRARIDRHFTGAGFSPYDGVLELRDARLTDYRDGSVVFEQLGVEFPADWSLTASNIVTSIFLLASPSAQVA